MFLQYVGSGRGRIRGLPLGLGGPSRLGLVGFLPLFFGPSCGSNCGGGPRDGYPDGLQKSKSPIKGLKLPTPEPLPDFLQLEIRSGSKSGIRLLFKRMSAGTSALSSSSSNSYS